MARSLAYTTHDVFTSTLYAGNPLAVVQVPSSTSLTQEQKQVIAREFNYSETVFLHTPPADTSDGTTQIPEWTVDIFLVDAEVPFAGHPTIGTAVHALSSLVKSPDEVVKGRFRVKAGIIDLVYSHGEARAGIPHDVHIHSAPYEVDALWALQPRLKEQMNGASPEAMDVVSVVKGMTFIFIQLPSLETLGSVALHAGRPYATRDEGWDQGVMFAMYYVILPPEADGTIRLRTRMIEGSFEDPATGSASCGLGALLAMKDGVKGDSRKYEMVQAVEIGRQSDIGVEVSTRVDGKIDTVTLIGRAIQVMEGKVAY